MKFVSAAKFYKADVIILGGDITGKMIVPILTQPGGGYLYEFFGERKTISSDSELETVEKNIRNMGYYACVMGQSEAEALRSDQSKLDDLFSRLMIESVRSWIKILESRLRDTETKCFISPGNDDRLAIDEVLNASDCVVNPEDRVVEIDSHHEMISSGWSIPTPWNSPRECGEEELEAKIESMASKVKEMKSCVFNLHCPPFNSVIDEAPQVDFNLKPVVSGGQMIMAPAGSKSVRKSIQMHQPLLGLHGHIHESRGMRKLGATLCLNPGSEYTEGILRGAIVNLNEKGIMSHLFVSG